MVLPYLSTFFFLLCKRNVFSQILPERIQVKIVMTQIRWYVGKMYLNSDTLRRNAGTEHNETQTTEAHSVSVHSVSHPYSAAAADSYVNM